MSEYESTAKYYDQLLYPAMVRVRKTVVKEIKKLKPAKIVDLCCGTGNQLKFLTRNGFKDIYGVDISADMLTVARKNKVNCRLEDATKTSFFDNEFDLAMVSFALHEKPYVVASEIIQEAQRIVKPGGYFLVVDYSFNHKATKIGKAIISWVEKHAGEEHYTNFNAFLAYGGLEKLIVNYTSVKEKRFHLGATVFRVYQF